MAFSSPNISILVAARNEASNILDCLRALEALSYPKENLQILIGDDASEDQTATLVEAFIDGKNQFELVRMADHDQQDPLLGPILKGKTRVLAHLAERATGEFLFFTDADIEVPPHWVENMLPYFQRNTAVVTGITGMKQEASHWVFGGFQSLEWLYYLSVMRAFSLFEVPITAMGNNMAITRNAYLDVGGYEAIGFSVTEDYALFRAILNKNYRFAQLFDQRVLAISKPVPTFAQLLTQRKRWMHGAMSLPWGQRLGVYANGFLLPVMLILAFFWPKAALVASAFMYIFTTAWLIGAVSWIQQQSLFSLTPLFWFYHILMNFAMLINYYTTHQTVWKGRKYEAL